MPRYFTSTAVATGLVGSINSLVTTIQVTALSGYPSTYPWTGIIDRGTATEEIVTVTNVVGTTLTVTRGVDGSVAQNHGPSATFEHGTSARDYNEPQQHIASSAGVHGLTGDVVGTTDAQTLSNKLLDIPHIADFSQANHDHATTAGGGVLPGYGAWTVYTPTWVFASGALGNATVSGRYRQLGKMVDVVATVTSGSTTSLNVGDITATLPVSAVPVNRIWVGTGLLRPRVAPGYRALTSIIFSNAGVMHAYLANATTGELLPPGSQAAAQGWDFGTGADLNLQIRYEAA